MVDIVALLQCVRPHVTATPVRQLSHIIVAMVALGDTILGILQNLIVLIRSVLSGRRR